MGHRVSPLEIVVAVVIAGGALIAILKARNVGPGSPGPWREAPGYGKSHWNRNGRTKLHWQETLELEHKTTGKNESTVRAFVQNLTIAGVWHHLAALGFDPIGPAAVMLHETGYGHSLAAKEYDNLLGISYTDRSSGKPVDRPYKFDSVPHCLEFLDTMMHWSLYTKAQAFAKDPKQYVTALHEAGFNSSESWLRGVLGAVDKITAYLKK